MKEFNPTPAVFKYIIFVGDMGGYSERAASEVAKRWKVDIDECVITRSVETAERLRNDTPGTRILGVSHLLSSGTYNKPQMSDYVLFPGMECNSSMDAKEIDDILLAQRYGLEEYHNTANRGFRIMDSNRMARRYREDGFVVLLPQYNTNVETLNYTLPWVSTFAEPL